MQSEETERGHVRIGELSHRVGVSRELLRAWETRYGLFSPTRTAGGFRLYGEDDERRVRRMLEHLAAGVSAAEAARLARAEPETTAQVASNAAPVDPIGAQLRGALDRFDEAGAHAAFDRLLADFALETVLREAVLPYLKDLGERWSAGEASIAQEHFASTLLRGRLLGLARGWGNGSGPLGLLACLPEDQHDLGLICFGLALRGHGWRIMFLGTDTPLAEISETARLKEAALVVLTAALTEHVTNNLDDLNEIAAHAPLALAGAGADSVTAKSIGARYLNEDPVTAAATVARHTAKSPNARTPTA